ncbi:hypothetical protein GCM10009661_62880 [Catellatospora chokoriensis]|uniref:Phage baseplate protein n=2 Tax=Catellatospora chokoriensis TaxID=310353 RepID=A0A8J3JXP4_9ACTN|nr:hypothetical protein Cch02nite_38330 [Catellatospora chokoriensis]
MLDARSLLRGWEAAAGSPPAARGAVLVHHAGAAADVADVLDLPLGDVAALAAEVYADMFGPAVAGLVPCPECGELLEAQIDLSEAGISGAQPTRDVAPLGVRTGAGELVVSALTVRDLLAVRGLPEQQAVPALVSACASWPDGRPVTPDQLGDGDLALVDTAARQLAGAAAVTLSMNCPACGSDIRAGVDVAALLWQRIDAAAPRLLSEVATLAGAYGWSEDSVLAMSARRRRSYLALVGS